MEKDIFGSLRDRLVAEIEAEAILTASYTGKVVFNRAVMEVIGRIPRHEFVPVELQPYAYLNRPLPIGFDKTISQPYIVALMTDLLELEADDVVLEVGAGAGYQAAVAAQLAKQVYTVDLVEELAAGAERRLKRLGYDNVAVRIGNGYYGWAEHAPYDKIIVTAACDLIPPPLLAQLKPGGRMVIPTGIPEKQALTLVQKSASGKLSTRDLLPVRFSELDEPGTLAGAA
ncbi:MAG TPA: protein-L-isoaspartate(D-aspartate) O-methyltransferase [Burkholderiales bacterium]|jgi:protein-L-isoaspartate(D-aspartate) O-methyltransferase|nr:protein-L-isoaspartate(D-aspartate) O-methyltransferase [Burkholderiales bacterium]